LTLKNVLKNHWFTFPKSW